MRSGEAGGPEEASLIKENIETMMMGLRMRCLQMTGGMEEGNYTSKENAGTRTMELRDKMHDDWRVKGWL